MPVQPGNSLLTDYHWPQMTEEERRDAARDLGVAEGWVARNLKISPQFARIAAAQGLPLLETSVREHPDDLTAREFLGHALEILDRPQDALHAFEAILRFEPNRELALRSSGRLLDRLGRHDLARPAWQKTIAINPWHRATGWHWRTTAIRPEIGQEPSPHVTRRSGSTLNWSRHVAPRPVLFTVTGARPGRRRVSAPGTLLSSQPRRLAAVV